MTEWRINETCSRLPDHANAEGRGVGQQPSEREARNTPTCTADMQPASCEGSGAERDVRERSTELREYLSSLAPCPTPVHARPTSGLPVASLKPTPARTSELRAFQLTIVYIIYMPCHFLVYGTSISLVC